MANLNVIEILDKKRIFTYFIDDLISHGSLPVECLAVLRQCRNAIFSGYSRWGFESGMYMVDWVGFLCREIKDGIIFENSVYAKISKMEFHQQARQALEDDKPICLVQALLRANLYFRSMSEGDREEIELLIQKLNQWSEATIQVERTLIEISENQGTFTMLARALIRKNVIPADCIPVLESLMDYIGAHSCGWKSSVSQTIFSWYRILCQEIKTGIVPEDTFYAHISKKKFHKEAREAFKLNQPVRLIQAMLNSYFHFYIMDQKSKIEMKKMSRSLDEWNERPKRNFDTLFNILRKYRNFLNFSRELNNKFPLDLEWHEALRNAGKQIGSSSRHWRAESKLLFHDWIEILCDEIEYDLTPTDTRYIKFCQKRLYYNKMMREAVFNNQPIRLTRTIIKSYYYFYDVYISSADRVLDDILESLKPWVETKDIPTSFTSGCPSIKDLTTNFSDASSSSSNVATSSSTSSTSSIQEYYLEVVDRLATVACCQSDLEFHKAMHEFLNLDLSPSPASSSSKMMNLAFHKVMTYIVDNFVYSSDAQEQTKLIPILTMYFQNLTALPAVESPLHLELANNIATNVDTLDVKFHTTFATFLTMTAEKTSDMAGHAKKKILLSLADKATETSQSQWIEALMVYFKC